MHFRCCFSTLHVFLSSSLQETGLNLVIGVNLVSRSGRAVSTSHSLIIIILGVTKYVNVPISLLVSPSFSALPCSKGVPISMCMPTCWTLASIVFGFVGLGWVLQQSLFEKTCGLLWNLNALSYSNGPARIQGPSQLYMPPAPESYQKDNVLIFDLLSAWIPTSCTCIPKSTRDTKFGEWTTLLTYL